MYGLSKSEERLLKSLRTPEKIQDFLDTIPTNFEHNGDTCLSPRRVLRERHAHCMEGAMFAALALRFQGHPPLVMDLKVEGNDDDHIVTPFKMRGCWGAISKTNHAVVRYRDPVYRTLRELVMSYFHEYTTDEGRKILRCYSRPVNLARFDARRWMTSEDDLFYIPHFIDEAPHYDLLTSAQEKLIRRADAMERTVGTMLEWNPRGRNY